MRPAPGHRRWLDQMADTAGLLPPAAGPSLDPADPVGVAGCRWRSSDKSNWGHSAARNRPLGNTLAARLCPGRSARRLPPGRTFVLARAGAGARTGWSMRLGSLESARAQPGPD